MNRLEGAMGLDAQGPPEERAVRILAKSIHRELRQGGWREEDVLALATELLSLVSNGVRGRREPLG